MNTQKKFRVLLFVQMCLIAKTVIWSLINHVDKKKGYFVFQKSDFTQNECSKKTNNRLLTPIFI